MKKVISLCLPYFIKNYNGLDFKLFRIADYVDGQYFPISLNTDEYNPKTIRFDPNFSAPSKYKPELRLWEQIYIKDKDVYSNRSFNYYDANFYEIVIDSENMSQNNDTFIQRLKTGISLPVCLTNYFLLAIDEDADTYRTVLCRLSDFKKRGEKYVLSSNVEDIEHAIHSLEILYIRKDEIIDSQSAYNYYDENGTLASNRYFYCFDELPKEDGRLYIYRFEEYLPIYLSRYIKSHSSNLGLSKNNLQNVITVIKNAINDKVEQEKFFSVAGFEDIGVFEHRLSDYEETIIAQLTERGFLNNAVTRILSNSEEMQDKFISCAKDIWFKQNTEDRKNAEQELLEKQKELNQINTMKSNLSKEYNQLTEKYNKLNEQYNGIISATQKSISNLSNSITEHIINSEIYSSILNNNKTDVPVEKSSVFFDESALLETTEKYTIDDLSKANRILELNLKNTGLNPLFGTVLSRIFIGSDSTIKSVIVPGIFARNIANAFSYSMDGHGAIHIVVSNPSVDYADIYKSVEKITSKVILIENILDTCNEIVYLSLNKDFSDKIFIFSYESESSLSLLSKSIWNYGILLNTDIAISTFVRDCKFKPAMIISDIEKSGCDFQFDIDSDLAYSLQMLKFSRTTIMIISSIFEYVNSHLDNMDISLFTDSIIAKFTYLYEDLINEDTIDSIRNNLNTDIKRKYGI